MTESFDKFAAQFATQSTMTNEETIALYNEYKEGSAKAYDTLVSGNMKLVLKIANDYKRYGMEIEDIVGNGTLGLMRAIDMFKPECGAFSQYASAWINKYIRMGFDVGRQVKTRRYSRMDETERSQCVCESLNEKIGDGETEFAESLEAEGMSPSEKCEMDDGVKSMMDVIATVLTERERLVLTRRNGIGCDAMTLEDIAGMIGCTRERVRQIEKEAFDKVRDAMTA